MMGQQGQVSKGRFVPLTASLHSTHSCPCAFWANYELETPVLGPGWSSFQISLFPLPFGSTHRYQEARPAGVTSLFADGNPGAGRTLSRF